MATATIKAERDMLKKIEASLAKLAAKHAIPEAVETLIPPLLSPIKASAARQKQYAQRLRYGLQHYYSRHHHRTEPAESEE